MLFLNNASHALSPLVGSDQGRFRVINEAATSTARVLTVGFEPLVSTSDLGSARTALVTSMSAALSLSDFVTFMALLKFMWVRNWLKGLQEAQ